MLVPSVPAALTDPIPLPDRPIKGLRDVALMAADWEQFALRANGDRAAVACIIARAEAQAKSAPLPDCLTEVPK